MQQISLRNAFSRQSSGSAGVSAVAAAKRHLTDPEDNGVPPADELFEDSGKMSSASDAEFDRWGWSKKVHRPLVRAMNDADGVLW